MRQLAVDNIEQFKRQLVDPLNAEFGKNLVVMKVTDSTVVLTCQYIGCKFRMSFKYEATPQDAQKVKFKRDGVTNHHHSFAAHKKCETKVIITPE